jgi:hypothetical protein
MEKEEPDRPKMKAGDVADFILDAGVFLMSSGSYPLWVKALPQPPWPLFSKPVGLT